MKKSLKALLLAELKPLDRPFESLLVGGFAAINPDGVNNCNCFDVPGNNCRCNGNNCSCHTSVSNNCTCGIGDNGLPNNCVCYLQPESESNAALPAFLL